jgi:hypothetical protein
MANIHHPGEGAMPNVDEMAQRSYQLQRAPA